MTFKDLMQGEKLHGLTLQPPVLCLWPSMQACQHPCHRMHGERQPYRYLSQTAKDIICELIHQFLCSKLTVFTTDQLLKQSRQHGPQIAIPHTWNSCHFISSGSASPAPPKKFTMRYTQAKR